jgi:excisionase family DNA binding protein
MALPYPMSDTASMLWGLMGNLALNPRSLSGFKDTGIHIQKMMKSLTKKGGMPMTKKEHYSVAEVADFLGGHPSWVYQLINSGKLPHIKVGTFHMIPAADLRKYKRMNKRKVKV